MSNMTPLPPTAHLGSPGSKVILEAPDASIKSSNINAHEVDLKIDHGLNLEDLLLHRGEYKNIVSDVMGLWTQDKMALSKDMNLSYSLILSAPSINVNALLHSTKDITLLATVGDVVTDDKTASKDKKATPKNLVHADGKVTIGAQGSYINNKGGVLGKEVYIDAQENIVNHGGTIHGTTFLHINAVKGDLKNECIEHPVQNGRNTYDPGRVLGGTGEGHNGIGLDLHTGGKVINDASIIHSVGSNLMDAEKGFDTRARSHRYVAYHSHHKTWYGKETEKLDIATQIQPAEISSEQGKNIFISHHGGFNSCSTQIFAPEGNDFNVQGPPKFTGIIGSLKHYESSSNLWGLSSDKLTREDEFAVPTVLASLKDMHIISQDVAYFTNVLVVGPGKLVLDTKGVVFSAPILNHYQKIESRTLGLQGPGCPGTTPAQIYNAYQSLSRAQSGTEWTAATWNSCIDGINITNSVLSGYRNGSLAQTLFPTSSMKIGGLSYTDTHSTTHWQTKAPNVGLYMGGLEIKEPDSTLALLNGMPVSIAGDTIIHVKKFIQKGAPLTSSTNTNTKSASLGVSADLKADAGFNYGHSNSQSTTYSNQNFYVGGKLDLQTKEWVMDAANVIAGTLTGHADLLSLTSRCNTSSSHSQNVQFDTKGNMSYQQSSGKSALIGVPTGIDVKGETTFTADKVNLVGGKLIFEGTNHFSAKELRSQAVAEYNKFNSFGLCVNINDLFSDDSSRQWNQAIPSIGLQFSKQDYQARQLGTVWSPQSTMQNIQSIKGMLETKNQSGLQVRRDDHESYQVKVPLYNPAGLKQLRDNLSWGYDQISPPKNFHATLPAETKHLDHKSEDKKPSHVTSKNQAKYHDQEFDDEFLENAQRTVDDVGQGLHKPIRLTGGQVRLFGHSGVERKWEDNGSSKNKWQSLGSEKKNDDLKNSWWHDQSVIMDATHRAIKNVARQFVGDIEDDVHDLFYGGWKEKRHAAVDLGEKGFTVVAIVTPFGRSLGVEGGAARLGLLEKEIYGSEIALPISKHPLEGLTPEEVVLRAGSLGLKTPKDSLVLWSGLGKNGIEESQAFSKANGGMTLEMTPGGMWLNKMDLLGRNSPFTREEAMEIWAQASKSAVRQASGQVRALLGGVSPQSIYMTDEMFELRNNSHILGVDELYLKPKYIFERNLRR